MSTKYFFIVFVFFSIKSSAQLWFEDFSGESNGATTGTAGGTLGGTWSVTTTPGGTFSRQNVFLIGPVFSINNTGTEGTWSTNNVDISSVGYAIIDVGIVTAGFGFTSSDYIRLYYSLDNGPEVLFADINGSLFSSTNQASAIVAGNSLRIIIKGVDNTGLGVIAFDDVSITAAPIIYSRKSGSWTDVTGGSGGTGTWSLVSHTAATSCGCVPLNTQVAVIGNGHTVTLPSSQTAIGTPPTTNLAPGAVDIRASSTLQFNTNGVALGIQQGLLRVRSGGTVSSSSGAITGEQISFNANLGGASLQVDAGGSVAIEDLVLAPGATNLHYLTGGGSLTITDDILINADGGTLTNDFTGTLSVTDRVEFQTGINDAAFINNQTFSIPTIDYEDTDCSFTNNGTLTVTTIQCGAATDDDNIFTNSSTGTLNLGTVNPAVADFNFFNSGTIAQTGNFTNISAASNFDNLATGTWNWSLTPNATYDADMNTTLNCSATGNTFNYSGAGVQSIITSTYYNLRLTNSGTKTPVAALDVNGDLTIQSTAVLSTAALAIDVDGDISIQNTAILGDGTSTGTINIGGDWSAVNAASYVEGSRTVNFDGAGAQIITNTAGTETFGNLTISGSGIKSSSNLIDINGNLSIAGTAQFSVSNDITLTGNWAVTSTNADPFIEGLQTVTFDGTGAQSISTVRAAGETFNNLSITVSGIKSNTSIINVAGNLLIAGNNTTQLSAGANILVGGDWTVTSTNADPFVQSTRTVTFNGSIPQTISTVLAAGETFNNLIINNSSGSSPQIILNDIVSVSSALTMTDGIVQTSATNLLILLNAATSTIGSATSYVDGPMQFNMAVNATNRTLNFPIGKSGTYGAVALRVRHNAATSYSYTAEVIASSAIALGYTLATGTDRVSGIRYWDIRRGTTAAPLTTNNTNLVTTGGNAPQLTINYVAADQVNQPATLTVVKNVGAGTAWFNIGATAAGSPAGSVTTTAPSVNFTSFSFFTLANLTGGTNPLPIELLSFDAKVVNDRVMLEWETASELNNDFFTLERAFNIEEFKPFGEPIDGKGTTAERNDYIAFDENPIYGRSYYRLKQTDFDGAFTYSPVKTIDYEGPKFSVLKVYPNPSGGHQITIHMNGLKDQPTVPIQIFNVQGQKVFDQVLDVTTPGTLRQELEFSTPLKQGLYIIKAGQTLQMTQKIIVD